MQYVMEDMLVASVPKGENNIDLMMLESIVTPKRQMQNIEEKQQNALRE
jgi:hypothetical protein